jgi:hypothetical protein
MFSVLIWDLGILKTCQAKNVTLGKCLLWFFHHYKSHQFSSPTSFSSSKIIQDVEQLWNLFLAIGKFDWWHALDAFVWKLLLDLVFLSHEHVLYLVLFIVSLELWNKFEFRVLYASILMVGLLETIWTIVLRG